MGSLAIRQIKYSGEKYFFESPIFDNGINIIEGDNGSGKTTLSYFIEFGLGGDIKAFSRDNKETYQQIVEDKKNYVEIHLELNHTKYQLKRFIGRNDIFVHFPDGSVKEYCTVRQHCSKIVFSDWLLEQLNIKKFQLNLGATTWIFNFNDVFRLLNYDQGTEPKKIFKSPNNDNFVTDSLTIRKSTFETLMGTSSDEYFAKFNELNKAKLEKDEAKYFLDEYNKLNPNLISDLKTIKQQENNLLEQLDKLIENREIYQKQHVKIDEKFSNIEETKLQLIHLEIENSKHIINKKNMQIELDKINKLLSIQQNEINSIRKSLFTHEKLNLFDFEVCPFCANSVTKEKNTCLCGHDLSETNYEKFLYDSSEYKEILKHKEKSLESIQMSIHSFVAQINEIEKKLEQNKIEINKLNNFLKSAIESIEYSGNSKIIESIDNKIGVVKNEIFACSELLTQYTLKEKHEQNYNNKETAFKSANEEYKLIKLAHSKNIKNIIDHFNIIYNELMKKSSSKASSALIDEDYMPVIDHGIYREKSAIVSTRMMYYFTLLAMSLKYESIKHPKFLLMDTPEDAGIDNISENIKLFEEALELSKKSPTAGISNYQFILTTAIKKYPPEFEKYVKLHFNKHKNNFILTERQNTHS